MESFNIGDGTIGNFAGANNVEESCSMIAMACDKLSGICKRRVLPAPLSSRDGYGPTTVFRLTGGGVPPGKERKEGGLISNDRIDGCFSDVIEAADVAIDKVVMSVASPCASLLDEFRLNSVEVVFVARASGDYDGDDDEYPSPSAIDISSGVGRFNGT